MNKYINLIYIFATFLWCSSAFAQEAAEEPTNTELSEPIEALATQDDVDASDATPGDASEPDAQSAEIDAQSAETDAQVADDAVQPEPAPIATAPIKQDSPPIVIAVPPNEVAEAAQDNEESDEIAPQSTGWRQGVGLYLGIGPAFDLRDPAAGYSARIGVDLRFSKYVSIGFEVTWNMLWATVSTKHTDIEDVDYRNTNSGFSLMLHGYIPATEHFIVTLGGGVGLGRRYEIAFSDIKSNADGPSWLARLQVGGMWLFDNQLTVGLDLESNFGNYISTRGMWWSDTSDEISLGLVCSISYQFFK